MKTSTPISRQKMAGKKPADARSDQSNSNKGSQGTNKLYDQNQGNRGKQLNPNQVKK